MVTRLKNLFGILVIICSSFFYSALAEQGYSLFLKNGVQVDDLTYEFDITIKSDGGEIELTSYQSSLSYDNSFLNNTNGELTFFYKTGSSTLTNFPFLRIGVYKSEDDFLLTFASLPGIDIISEEEKTVGRFIIRSTIPFSVSELNIDWNKQGNIYTILTGSNFSDITNPQNHFNFLHGSTNVNDQIKNIDFYLEQNYPNPFNPSTNIKFFIPTESFVRFRSF